MGTKMDDIRVSSWCSENLSIRQKTDCETNKNPQDPDAHRQCSYLDILNLLNANGSQNVTNMPVFSKVQSCEMWLLTWNKIRWNIQLPRHPIARALKNAGQSGFCFTNFIENKVLVRSLRTHSSLQWHKQAQSSNFSEKLSVFTVDYIW